MIAGHVMARGAAGGALGVADGVAASRLTAL
jgi:hypothetical protein